MSYILFLGVTFAGGLMIFTWLLLNWLVFNILNDLGGWPFILFISWLGGVVIFFQGTRIQRWLDDLRH